MQKEGRKEGWMDGWMNRWMDEVWTENFFFIYFSLFSYPIANHRLWLVMY
jgi:hypothetical protein